MNNQENQPGALSRAQYLDFVLLATALATLVWLTSRMPAPSRFIILFSVLPGPLIGAVGILFWGRNAISSSRKLSLITGLCFVSAGIACTIAGITLFPNQLALISASGIAILGLYVAWMVRTIQRTALTATA